MVQTTDIHPTRETTQRPGDIVFTKVDTNWVHHPYEDALVVTAKIANNIIHWMLIDNSNAANILSWDAYLKMGLTRADLSPKTSPLYGFTGDNIIPEGAIKVAATLGEHP